MVVGSSPTIHHHEIFQTFPHVELEKYSARYTQEMKRLGYVDRSARISSRPYPVVAGGKSVIRLSLGKLLIG